jgi:hypothetical protein
MELPRDDIMMLGRWACTYNVIDRVFQEELGYDRAKNFDEQLYLHSLRRSEDGIACSDGPKRTSENRRLLR